MEPDSDPATFATDRQDAKKILWFSKFFCLILFEETFISFFKDKVEKRNKTVGIQDFLTIFA
jgi:hypothetical protein